MPDAPAVASGEFFPGPKSAAVFPEPNSNAAGPTASPEPARTEPPKPEISPEMKKKMEMMAGSKSAIILTPEETAKMKGSVTGWRTIGPPVRIDGTQSISHAQQHP